MDVLTRAFMTLLSYCCRICSSTLWIVPNSDRKYWTQYRRLSWVSRWLSFLWPSILRVIFLQMGSLGFYNSFLICSRLTTRGSCKICSRIAWSYCAPCSGIIKSSAFRSGQLNAVEGSRHASRLSSPSSKSSATLWIYRTKTEKLVRSVVLWQRQMWCSSSWTHWSTWTMIWCRLASAWPLDWSLAQRAPSNSLSNSFKVMVWE